MVLKDYTQPETGNYPFVVTVGYRQKQILASWVKRTNYLYCFNSISLTFFIHFSFYIFLRSQDQLEEQRNQAIQASKLSSLGRWAGGIAH